MQTHKKLLYTVRKSRTWFILWLRLIKLYFFDTLCVHQNCTLR